MNIWKLTYPIQDKNLIAVVIALTPNDARTLVAKSQSFALPTTNTCKQLGTAATNIRAPEIVLMMMVEPVINTNS